MRVEIEIFRILSAFGIVWFHSGIDIGRDIAYGGLIYFLIISAYFATISTRSHSIIERAERLLIPFLLWSLFYGSIHFITKGYFFPENYTFVSKVLASPSIHLWFLPFVFFSLIAIDNLRQIISKKWVVTAIGLTAISLILFSPKWREISFIPPLGQYIHAFPAILIGIFLGVMHQIRIKWILIIGIIASIVIMIYKKEPGVGIPYLTGFIPCYFLFKGNRINNKKSLLLNISSATYGVYLLHVFIFLILIKFDISGILLPVLVFILSLLSVVTLKKYIPNKFIKYVM